MIFADAHIYGIANCREAMHIMHTNRVFLNDWTARCTCTVDYYLIANIAIVNFITSVITYLSRVVILLSFNRIQ